MSSKQPSQLEWKLVLAARASSTPPSELEVLLRSHCHRIKVVEKLNGAHLLIPMTFPSKNGEVTVSKSLAVRFYSTSDISRLSLAADLSIGTDSEELGGLQKFSNSFALSLVFLVLPETSSLVNNDDESILVSELETCNSWTRRAMDLVTSSTFPRNDAKSCCCRIIIVPDAKTALEGIRAFAVALKPEKEALKQAFFRRQELQYCVPKSSSRNSTNDGKAVNDHQKTQYASNHVRQVFANWARRFELPVGEEDVLMEMLGNLQTIASLKHQDVPIEDRTRQMLNSFFDLSDTGCVNGSSYHGNSNATTCQHETILSQQLPTENHQEGYLGEQLQGRYSSKGVEGPNSQTWIVGQQPSAQQYLQMHGGSWEGQEYFMTGPETYRSHQDDQHHNQGRFNDLEPPHMLHQPSELRHQHITMPRSLHARPFMSQPHDYHNPVYGARAPLKGFEGQEVEIAYNQPPHHVLPQRAQRLPPAQFGRTAPATMTQQSGMHGMGFRGEMIGSFHPSNAHLTIKQNLPTQQQHLYGLRQWM
ncbi:hypothetical protein ACA910_021103 [Epithemia clementina (nom. ined.)]